MQRYNLFNQVHKGLKALLYETALQVQHTDFRDVGAAEDTIERITEVVELFGKHAHAEDDFVFTVIGKYGPAVKDAFEQEHVKDHLLGQMLDECTCMYRNAPVITEKVEIGQLLQSAYLRFMVFNIEHMAKEEDILNPILWRYLSDVELHVVTQQIVSNTPQEYLSRFSKWMIRGLNNAEITCWLKSVERTAPKPVFNTLFAAAEKELNDTRFRQVVEGLTEGTMLN